MQRRQFLCGCIAACAVGAPRTWAQEQSLTLKRVEDVPGEPRESAVWFHTSWRTLTSGSFSSNGVVVFGRRRTLLLDTPWNVDDAALLLSGVERIAPPQRRKLLVLTHAHDDRMIGLPTMRAAGVGSLAFYLSAEDAPARGLAWPDAVWRGRERRIDLGGRQVTLFYPGPAHTRDNTVAFVEEKGVLFGGCMIRAANTTALGNVADADVTAWPVSVRAVKARFGPMIRHVIPGHGAPGGPELLDHTIALADAAAAARG